MASGYANLQAQFLPVARGLWAFFTNKEKFIELATNHHFALSLQAPDIFARYEAGTWPPPDFIAEMRTNIGDRLSRTREDFFNCGAVLIAILGVALAFNTAIGRPWPTWPADGGKLLSAFGGGLAAWGTYFQLSIQQTWKGRSAEEIVRQHLFKLSFVSGAAMAIAGALW